MSTKSKVISRAQQAERVTNLLIECRIAQSDAKSANGYPCFSIKSITLLKRLQKQIGKVLETI